MFYEEQVVHGVLCSRSTPDGEWVPVAGGESKVTRNIPLTADEIVTEDERFYHFPGGTTLPLKNVTTVRLDKDGQTHHVKTADGYDHYIPAGWVGVTIKSRQFNLPSA